MGEWRLLAKQRKKCKILLKKRAYFLQKDDLFFIKKKCFLLKLDKKTVGAVYACARGIPFFEFRLIFCI